VDSSCNASTVPSVGNARSAYAESFADVFAACEMRGSNLDVVYSMLTDRVF
jgi:hypothetical protein